MSVDPYMEIGAQSQLKLLTKDHLQAMSGKAKSEFSNRGSSDLQETSQINKSSIPNSLSVPGIAPAAVGSASDGGPGAPDYPPRLSVSQRSLSIALALEAQQEAQNEKKCFGWLPNFCATQGADQAMEEDRPNPDLDEGKNLPSVYEPMPPELEGLPLEELDSNRSQHKVSRKFYLYRFFITAFFLYFHQEVDIFAMKL